MITTTNSRAPTWKDYVQMAFQEVTIHPASALNLSAGPSPTPSLLCHLCLILPLLWTLCPPTFSGTVVHESAASLLNLNLSRSTSAFEYALVPSSSIKQTSLGPSSRPHLSSPSKANFLRALSVLPHRHALPVSLPPGPTIPQKLRESPSRTSYRSDHLLILTFIPWTK